MARAVFIPVPSKTNNKRYVVHYDGSSEGLPVFGRQMSAQEMVTLKAGQPKNYPFGTDRRGDALAGKE